MYSHDDFTTQEPGLQSESNQRQIALVSYGTQYLRHGLALDDWYRHGIFFGARLQFRERDGNALLADDFTWWLGILRQAGAQRLSLHRLAQFDMASPSVMQDGQHAVVVHYRDHYEVWAVGTERPAWLEHPLLPDVPGIPIFPDATHWGGAIDSYWRLGERPGQLEVAETDWKALARVIATDLDINLPSSHIPAGPLYLPRRNLRRGSDCRCLPVALHRRWRMACWPRCTGSARALTMICIPKTKIALTSMLTKKALPRSATGAGASTPGSARCNCAAQTNAASRYR